MRISDLTAYAEEKYNMHEQHKWSDFPGFSVLADPDTGKWVVLLMRGWDQDLGENVERCDIKCGRDELKKSDAGFLSEPFRMHGPKWLGVTFDGATDPKVVKRLLDKAASKDSPYGIEITLGGIRTGSTKDQKEPLRIPPKDGQTWSYHDTPLFTADKLNSGFELVPGMIQKMVSLYEYGDGSYLDKCRNFYNQGMLMKDYTDNVPWFGDLRRLNPTYHDLNLLQLRGYFTWRAKLRRGEFTKTCSSFAYIYIYELLNGIGTSSPGESFEKLTEFQSGYIDTGMGDLSMKRSLRQWMMEFAVIYGFPEEVTLKYLEPGTLVMDKALAALKEPESVSDEVVFAALMRFASSKTASSPVITKAEDRGKHLFAEIWRHAASQKVCTKADVNCERRDLFTACFGEIRKEPWHPLSTAVYFEHRELKDKTYTVTGLRRYMFEDGAWKQETLSRLYRDKDAFLIFMHAADLRLRKALKAGHYLRERKEEAWAYALVDTALEEIKREEIEASRPKVSIDFSGLDKIREDAGVTRDSLLTEEELGIDTGAQTSLPGPAEEPGHDESEGDQTSSAVSEETDSGCYPEGLSAAEFRILKSLLDGAPVMALIRENHLMPQVVCDSINEALFDEIGDSVIVCDDDNISLVEDYIEDLKLLIGGEI